MKTENELRQIVAENIQKHRKAHGLTQLQLAERLNYSDKAISKWERGDSLPDLYMLSLLADMFGVTVNDLMEKDITIKIINKEYSLKNATWISFSATWVASTILFVLFMMFGPKTQAYAWLIPICTFPISALVLCVFFAIRKKKLYLLYSSSALIYTVPLAIASFLNWQYSSWALFIITIPAQLIAILLYYRKKPMK